MKAKDAIHRLRVIGLIEGISFLLLMGIAMPLKYIWDMPMAVKVVGWAHGVLFIGFCILLLVAMILARWSFARGALFFVAALIPFGPFLVDKRLRVYADEAEAATGA
ncbi:DUF3817 domain-containing protein [Rubellicoccus peritrichatus]|uniref:DUF3817 domain-containing protein n=1 Tax=Rubellicoccus peritrichatus TaxID=3080537 RepID=A0AAQ3QWB1_9BACT|nr:DUF3817 domain-containing protein [Puniceicoccus sp. CR14]WOO42498.1 DUF3817 domain-containing protein [Puniceicoccus sp. CR14]